MIARWRDECGARPVVTIERHVIAAGLEDLPKRVEIRPGLLLVRFDTFLKT
jgi:hypothetical protein